jgi:hypothetical protein
VLKNEYEGLGPSLVDIPDVVAKTVSCDGTCKGTLDLQIPLTGPELAAVEEGAGYVL